MPGPGALDGIHKCFSDLGGLNEADTIKFMADIQEEEFSRLDLVFRPLGSRRLQLIDVQNLFCEVSKYARVRHPDVGGTSKRKRIKQVYRQSPEPMTYWYPPKWGINHMFPSQETQTCNNWRGRESTHRVRRVGERSHNQPLPSSTGKTR